MTKPATQRNSDRVTMPAPDTSTSQPLFLQEREALTGINRGKAAAQALAEEGTFSGTAMPFIVQIDEMLASTLSDACKDSRLTERTRGATSAARADTRGWPLGIPSSAAGSDAFLDVASLAGQA